MEGKQSLDVLNIFWLLDDTFDVFLFFSFAF